jgi:hypothetical protein
MFFRSFLEDVIFRSHEKLPPDLKTYPFDVLSTHKVSIGDPEARRLVRIRRQRIILRQVVIRGFYQYLSRWSVRSGLVVIPPKLDSRLDVVVHAEKVRRVVFIF